MFLPEVAAHAAYLRGGILAVGIGIGGSNLWLLAVAAHVESLKLDEHRLPNGEGTEEAALGDADGNGTGGILDVERVIDVAALVVAGDDTPYLHRLLHLSQAVVVDLVLIELLDFGNGLQVGHLDVLVAIALQARLLSGCIPVAVVAGGEGCCEAAAY